MRTLLHVLNTWNSKEFSQEYKRIATPKMYSMKENFEIDTLALLNEIDA